MRYLLYFSLKSSLSFAEYPQLLAVANRCKTEVGHINHSRMFMDNYCDYVGEELRQEIINWALQQSAVNFTLDIGTCTGINSVSSTDDQWDTDS